LFDTNDKSTGGSMRNELIIKIQAALQDRVILKVARATGLSKTTIFRIRDGQYQNKGPQLGTVKVLADYLGVS